MKIILPLLFLVFTPPTASSRWQIMGDSTPPICTKATGGTITDSGGGITRHTFLANGTFTGTGLGGGTNLHFLIIGSGGAGGGVQGGGGGSGGEVVDTTVSYANGVYAVKVGVGGIGAVLGGFPAGDGDTSVFDNGGGAPIGAAGGGHGGDCQPPGCPLSDAGGTGANGGGGGANFGAGGGGIYHTGGSASIIGSGGAGGGGGGMGGNGVGGAAGGAGGPGVANTMDGNLYGGGGGGSLNVGTTTGGTGGGGNGGLNGSPGSPNSGGGGGGAANAGANGADGKIMIEYACP